MEWKAVREAASRSLPKHASAAAWKHRKVSLNKKGSRQCPIEVQSKETSLVWWQLRREEASLRGKQWALPWIGVNDSAEEQRLRADHAAKNQSTSRLAAWKSSRVPTTPIKRCRKADSWQINGAWTMVTSCVTQPWCCLSCRVSMSPTPESERSGTHRKQKSSST